MQIEVDIFLDRIRLKEILDTFEERVDRGLEKTATQGALQVIQNISEKFKVRTAELINSVGATREEWNRWDVIVGAKYGFYLEYGTVKMSAKPFFRPAIESLADDLYRNIRMELYGS